MPQRQSCTSIGKNIILTYFRDLIDRAKLETSDFEWKLVRFSYCLQVSEEYSAGHIGPKIGLKSPIFHVAPKKNSLSITLRRPEEKFPLRYLYVAQKKRYHYCM